MKTHWVRDADRGFPQKIITHCGMEGWYEDGNEYTTANGDRFDAAGGLNEVNCKRCLKSAERISKSPWGCKRAGTSIITSTTRK